MLKLVVLFSVVALAAANHGLLVPAVHNAVVPGVTSVSAYDTRIVHPSPVYTAPIVHASPLVYGAGLYNAHGLHRLHKRSLAVAPVSYNNIVGPSTLWGGYGAGYGTGYGLGAGYGLGGWNNLGLGGWNNLGLGWASAYPRALSVHPY